MRFRSLIFVAVLLLTASPLLAQEPGTETFTTDDGSFSFDYPAGWSVEVVNPDSPQPRLVVENLPDYESFESPEGLLLQISLPEKSFVVTVLSGGETPKEAVANIVNLAYGTGEALSTAFVTPSADGTPLPLQLQPGTPDVAEFMVNGRPAAYAYAVMQALGIDASQLIVIVDVGDDYWVTISTSSYKGGLETLQRYEPIVLEIARSMRYTPLPPDYSGNPNLPQVYSGTVGVWQVGNIEFYYPEDWYVVYYGMVLISNKPGNFINAAPESGQLIATVYGVLETRSLVDPTVLENMCEQSSDWTARTLVEEVMANTTPAQAQAMKDAGLTVTQPEVTTVNGVEIVYSRGYQGDIEMIDMFVDLGEGYIPAMSARTKKGEMAQYEAQLFAIAGTFQYTPIQCDQ